MTALQSSAGTSGEDSALTWVATLGAADIAAFLSARRDTLFAKSPSRAAGSVAGLVLWTALRVSCRLSASRPESSRRQRLTTGLALACGLGNLSLFAVHLRLGRGRLRSLPGAVLGAVALVLGARRPLLR
ncbi:MAG: hypothetical protein ACYCZN_14040 [Candidatus Dormibacteria bacterium]